MGLWFWNGYTDTVYIALLWYDPGCHPDPWRKVGWYGVAPGDSVQVVQGDLRHAQDRNFAWFAQADWADGPCWSGDPAHAWYAIPHNAAFNQCYDDNTGCNAAYPFVADTLNSADADSTILLLWPGAAGHGFQGWRSRMSGLPDMQLLNFSVPLQQESNWCWAAVSTGVAHYYDSASTVTQCQVVNQQLSRNDCCRNPGSSSCNVYGFLDQALTYVGHFVSLELQAATYAQIVEQIAVGRPPCIRITWAGGGAHFIGVSGCEPSNMLWVNDPTVVGPTLVSRAALTGGNYQGSGTWADTYFTS
ncbi:papain-like cysteine protease family protein [Mycobacterium sp.]|uniref:papain-like cysteine protease family protein n=1 Tax=Mycobacterium sp. TaxID=1785 RepID=UPI002C457048|nr:papain-like cysteine protease family protein [Mycobacterium sp.]HTQ20660.1 papain-like cysteine protease family protein [Mycobacterium sp.]